MKYLYWLGPEVLSAGATIVGTKKKQVNNEEQKEKHVKKACKKISNDYFIEEDGQLKMNLFDE